MFCSGDLAFQPSLQMNPYRPTYTPHKPYKLGSQVEAADEEELVVMQSRGDEAIPS